MRTCPPYWVKQKGPNQPRGDPGCVVGACMAPWSGQILDRVGPRRPILIGATCALVGVVLFAALSAHLETPPAICYYVCFAFGQSLMVGNSLTESLSFLPAATKADGNAVAWRRRHGRGDDGGHARSLPGTCCGGNRAARGHGVGHEAVWSRGLGKVIAIY